MDFRNKPECLSLASLSSLVKCLWVRPGAYPRVEPRVGSGVKKIVNKIMSLTIMNLITPKAGAKHELLFNEPASGHVRFDLVQFLVKLITIL